jgi:hypothetical protein
MVARERDQRGVALHSTTLDQNETNGNATFTTTIDFTASDGSVAAGHDTTLLLWNGVQDPEASAPIFELGFDKLRLDVAAAQEACQGWVFRHAGADDDRCCRSPPRLTKRRRSRIVATR